MRGHGAWLCEMVMFNAQGHSEVSGRVTHIQPVPAPGGTAPLLVPACLLLCLPELALRHLLVPLSDHLWTCPIQFQAQLSGLRTQSAPRAWRQVG